MIFGEMKTSLLVKAIFILYFLMLPAVQTSANDDDYATDFFKEFETSQKDVFEWIRDEYRFSKMPTRFQRDVDAVNGDTWYRNYQIKECQASNKSSFCSGHQVKHEQQEKDEKHAPEISELFDDLDKKDENSWSTAGTRDGEKLQKPTRHGDDENVVAGINDKNMKLEHLFPVSDHRELSGSNYNPNQFNVAARLNAKHFLAKQQNAVHEIELKHQHLVDDADDGEIPSEKTIEQSGNQLRTTSADTSSNSNFPFSFNLDSSSGDMKRSSGQKQQKHQHFDDQLDQKKNDLSDEVDEKLSKQEQQGLQTLHRVKRRDIGMDEINRLMTKANFNFEEFLQSHMSEDDEINDEIFKLLDEGNNSSDEMDNLVNDERTNTSASTSTANQEMNNGNEKDLRDKSECNETMSANINRTITSTADDAKIKRDISHRKRQRGIKGKQKISDLISGELPNEIVKAVHKLVDSNEKLKHHIKPHLTDPKFTKLKDSSKLSSIKINNMMGDLVEFINELVDDQIQMRTCISLTPELKDFYGKLIGRQIDEDSSDDPTDDVDDDGRYEKFLTPKKRFTRKATTHFKRKTVEEVDEKCNKVLALKTRSAGLQLSAEKKEYLEKFFKSHIQICDELKQEMMKEKKHERTPDYLNATQDFIKLESFKNYVVEMNVDDF